MCLAFSIATFLSLFLSLSRFPLVDHSSALFTSPADYINPPLVVKRTLAFRILSYFALELNVFYLTEMAPEPYTLHYFDLRARGEPVRLLLTLAGMCTTTAPIRVLSLSLRSCRPAVLRSSHCTDGVRRTQGDIPVRTAACARGEWKVSTNTNRKTTNK